MYLSVRILVFALHCMIESIECICHELKSGVAQIIIILTHFISNNMLRVQYLVNVSLCTNSGLCIALHD